MTKHKNITLESTSDIRNRLADHLDIISKLDPLPRERSYTGLIKRKLQEKFGTTCAYCGKIDEMDAAHIIPLEIGARTTEDNIILLCRLCHKYYDRGHISINAMSKIAEEWRRRSFPKQPRKQLSNISPPKPSITLPPDSLRKTFDIVLQLQRERKFLKAVRIVIRKLENDNITETERIYLLIKRAELFRRRSARGVVHQALQYLLEINPKKIPTRYLPVYFYELNYVYRLMGDHDQAAEVIRHSAEASLSCSGGRPQVDYVAALANELLCKMAAIEKLSKNQARDFERKLKELKTVAERCGDYWGGRWALNCAAHALQVRIKANDAKDNWRLLKELRNIYFDSDVTNGWDSGGYQTISLLDGLMHVLFPLSNQDIDTGTGILARSFMTRLGPRQRPEGIRDAGFGLAIGMSKSRSKSLMNISKHLKNLMQETVDGTSVLWPWHMKNCLG